jgi:hypothetical protein
LQMTGAASFENGGDSYKVTIPWVEVPVQAMISGTIGNVAANSLIVLRSNVSNVLSVTNQSAFTDGLEEESDLSRKARFALYIQSLARATKGALEYAARTVEQVIAAKAVDDVRPDVLVLDTTSESSELFYPLGVYVYEDEVYVTDFDISGQKPAYKTLVFDTQGAYRRTLGEPGMGDGQFNGLSLLCVYNSTEYGVEVFISDGANHRVQVLDVNGVYKRQWGTMGSGNGQFSYPCGIYVYNDEVYVSDLYSCRIQVFDLDGVYVRQWGSGPGTANGVFDGPGGLFVYNSEVFVTDIINARIQVFDTVGTFKRTWGSYGKTDGLFIGPTGICVYADEVYVVDPHPNGNPSIGNQRIQVFEIDGTYKRQWGSYGTTDGLFIQPYSIFLYGNEAYVADNGNNRIQVFDPTGSSIIPPPPGALGSKSNPIPMNWSTSGNTYYPSVGTGTVHSSYNLNGKIYFCIDSSYCRNQPIQQWHLTINGHNNSTLLFTKLAQDKTGRDLGVETVMANTSGNLSDTQINATPFDFNTTRWLYAVEGVQSIDLSVLFTPTAVTPPPIGALGSKTNPIYMNRAGVRAGTYYASVVDPDGVSYFWLPANSKTYFVVDPDVYSTNVRYFAFGTQGFNNPTLIYTRLPQTKAGVDLEGSETSTGNNTGDTGDQVMDLMPLDMHGVGGVGVAYAFQSTRFLYAVRNPGETFRINISVSFTNY